MDPDSMFNVEEEAEEDEEEEGGGGGGLGLLNSGDDWRLDRSAMRRAHELLLEAGPEGITQQQLGAKMGK